MTHEIETTDSRLVIDGRVALLTFERDDIRNALTGSALIDDIIAVADWVNGNPEISVLVLTGAGRAFCSGRDLTEAQINSIVTFLKSLTGELPPYARLETR